MSKAISAALAALVALSCATSDNVKPDTARIRPDSLFNFFRVCEQDSASAIEVIVKRDITKNLTHLQRMNSGGRKYYLLEREAITEMIRAVTKGLYDDFILINRHGVVVYTMADDTIFAKKVAVSFANTPLHECLEKTGDDLYLSDLGYLPGREGKRMLFVSGRVVREGSLHGIFLLQVNSETLRRLIGARETVVGRADGRIRLAGDGSAEDVPYPGFDRIPLASLADGANARATIGGASVTVAPFRYRTIDWIILARDR